MRTLAELLEASKPENLADLSAEEITALRTELTDLFRSFLDDEEIEKADKVVALDEIKTASAAVTAAIDARAAADAEIDAQIAQLEAEMLPPAEASDDGDDGDESDDDASDDGDEGNDDAAPAEADADLEPVVASGDRAASLRRMAARTPAAHRVPATPASPTAHSRITAPAEVSGFSAGQEMSIADMGRAAWDRLSAIRNARGGATFNFATIHADYGDAPTLGRDAAENSRIIAEYNAERLAEIQADGIIAAGGWCGPTEPYRGIAGLGSADRPIKAGLGGFNVTRGGVRYMTPPRLSQIVTDASGGAVTTHTAANDEASVTKTTQRITCGVENEVDLDSIVVQLTAGNFLDRSYPEWIARWIELAAIAQARVAERKILATIDANSTTMTSAQEYGAIRDVLNAISRAAVGLRSRHRELWDFPLQVILPDFVITAFQQDYSFALNADPENQHSLAKEAIERWFAVRNISVIWTPDAYVFPTETATNPKYIVDYPETVDARLFPAGSFQFLDGGSLDLGVTRDNTSNAANDFSIFAEDFEQTIFTGVVAYKVISTICANGASAASVTATTCGNVGYGS